MTTNDHNREDRPGAERPRSQGPELFIPRGQDQNELSQDRLAEEARMFKGQRQSNGMDMYRQRLQERRAETDARFGVQSSGSPINSSGRDESPQATDQRSIPRLSPQPQPRPNAPRNVRRTEPLQDPQEQIRLQRQTKSRDAAEAAKRFQSLQRANNRRRTFIVALIALAAILLTLLLIRTLTSHATPRPKLGIVQMGTVGDRYSAHGFVARDESILNSPVSGRLEPIVPEGQRVAMNTPVGLVLSDLDPSNYAAVRDLDRRIADRRLTVMNERNLSPAEELYESGDAQMHDSINAIRNSVRSGNLAEISSLQISLESMMQERNTALAEIEFSDPVLADLESEKRLYQAQVTQGSASLTAPAAGLVSFRPDSLATELTPQVLAEMDFQTFKEYYEKAEKRTVIPETVEAGEPVLTVLTGAAHYFALQINDIKSTDIPEGAPIVIEIPEDAITIGGGILERMTPNEEGVMLLISTNRELERLLGKRSAEVSILLNSDQGLKVPSSSLVYRDEESTGLASLYIVSGGFVEVETVRVLMSDREFALIEPMNANTNIRSGAIIVENPDSVEEGAAVG